MAVAGPGESPYSCDVGVRGERGRGQMSTRGYVGTVSASMLGCDSWWRRYRGICWMWADIEGLQGTGMVLEDPGAVLVWSEVVYGPGMRALRGGRTRRVAPRPRRAPP